jgi:L-lactate utilization protein LutB
MNEKAEYWAARLECAKQALERNGIEATVVATGAEAAEAALAEIPGGASVGLGGSQTVKEIGLLDTLRKGGYNLFDQYREGLGREEALAVRKQGAQADYFVSGSNAITDDGRIVNVDGLGNRLAAFCFGPGMVIIIAGRNKITADLDAAMERVRNVAAPMNARRFGLTTPCVKTGRCTDCASSERICNLTLIIEKQHTRGRMKVILVNEDLGY